jgi:hypothetical protein
MPIESATYIKDLDPTNPTATDSLADSDNHIRLIKAALKATFPNLDGVFSGKPANLNAYVPIGGIIMWSGSLDTIPAGWVLCAGQTGLSRTDGAGTIDAPDLRARFIRGAGTGTGFELPGTTGGSGFHSHNITVNGTALTIGQLPSHNHNVIDPGHGHTASVSDPGHAHTTTRYSLQPGAGGGAVPVWSGQAGDTTGVSLTGIGVSIGGSATGISIAGTGSNQAHSHSATADNTLHIPPYFALAFIMKL